MTLAIHHETRERLRALKVVPREPYDSVITRLIVAARPKDFEGPGAIPDVDPIPDRIKFVAARPKEGSA